MSGLTSPRFRPQLLAWFSRHGRQLPWRETTDPYAILVSEFMLQQTQVATVLPYYERWLTRFPDFAALARADESAVLHAWQGLGYYARARNLHAAARAVMERFDGALHRGCRADRDSSRNRSLYRRRGRQLRFRSTPNRLSTPTSRGCLLA